MQLSESEIKTIERALIIYDKRIPNGLRGKGFFIDASTAKEDIQNIILIRRKIDLYKRDFGDF